MCVCVLCVCLWVCFFYWPQSSEPRRLSGAGVLGGILHPHQNQEVEVVPHAVLRLDVLLKRNRLVVELVSFQTWKTQHQPFFIYMLPAHSCTRRGGEARRWNSPLDETGGFSGSLPPSVVFSTPQVRKGVVDWHRKWGWGRWWWRWRRTEDRKRTPGGKQKAPGWGGHRLNMEMRHFKQKLVKHKCHLCVFQAI